MNLKHAECGGYGTIIPKPRTCFLELNHSWARLASGASFDLATNQTRSAAVESISSNALSSRNSNGSLTCNCEIIIGDVLPLK